jgi:hypothetical protein
LFEVELHAYGFEVMIFGVEEEYLNSVKGV